MYNRRGFRWTTNECLQLQREYELLGLSIDEIAQRHQRTPQAIMFKLDQEGFADYNVVYESYYNLNNETPVSNLKNEFVSNLADDEEQDEEQDEDEEEDKSSNYSDESVFSEVSEDESCDSIIDLKDRVSRLEKQIVTLTEMLIKQNGKNKSVFSLFS